ncbi:MAG TPA: superoxide reductase [Thermoplasmatales archaeon]|nr:superoxide reductase [Thermoplasmatales archaeon]
MKEFEQLLQKADWKKEKHVPVLEVKQKDGLVQVEASVGKEIAHPNTTAHYIAAIELYFLPEGEKFPYLVGRHDFAAHGASTDGPDTSTVYTEPRVVAVFRTEKPGTLYAQSYCNIHGVWVNKEKIEMQTR